MKRTLISAVLAAAVATSPACYNPPVSTTPAATGTSCSDKAPGQSDSVRVVRLQECVQYIQGQLAEVEDVARDARSLAGIITGFWLVGIVGGAAVLIFR